MRGGAFVTNISKEIKQDMAIAEVACLPVSFIVGKPTAGAFFYVRR